MIAWLRRFEADDNGAVLVEYALVLGLVSLVSLLALNTFAAQATAAFNAFTNLWLDAEGTGQ